MFKRVGGKSFKCNISEFCSLVCPAPKGTRGPFLGHRCGWGPKELALEPGASSQDSACSPGKWDEQPALQKGS